jgi:ABC-type antimicrobial peptide transport system permease subunit
MVLRQGLLLTGIGVAAGAGGAFVMAPVLKSLLFGVTAGDPISYAAAIGVMTIAVLLSCGIPAWRAARVDPVLALRDEG